MAAPASRTRSSVATACLRVHARRVAVDAAAALVAQEDPLEDQVQERARLVALEALARQRDRRLDEVAPLARREAAVDLLETGEEPGDRDRALADVEDLRPGVAEVDDELLHLAEPARRNLEEAVEHRRLAGGLVDEREAASGRARERPFRDECGERGCEQRVDGVPAVAQHARAGLGRERVTGCDRASHPGRLLRGAQPVFRNDGSSGSTVRC